MKKVTSKKSNRQELKIFKIPVEWSMIGDLHIQAKTIKEAIKKAKDPDIEFSNSNDSVYVDGSFRVKEETINQFEGDTYLFESTTTPLPEKIRQAMINNLLDEVDDCELNDLISDRKDDIQEKCDNLSDEQLQINYYLLHPVDDIKGWLPSDEICDAAKDFDNYK